MFGKPRYGLTTPQLPNITRLVPFERHLAIVRWQFFRGVLIGIMGCSAIAIPAFKYSNSRQHGPSLRQGLGQTALGNRDAQAASRAQKSTSETVETSFPPPTLPKPQPLRPSNHSADHAAQHVVTTDRAESPASLAVSQSAPSTDAPFPEPRPPKKTLATLAQLWASVEAGNTKAALALADIYLRGDGIPVNCEQARVLLFVASKENNAEATKKLQELDQTGCPAP